MYEMPKKKNKFIWIEECQRLFEYIKEIIITPLLLRMQMANDKFQLESGNNKTAAGSVIFL